MHTNLIICLNRLYTLVLLCNSFLKAILSRNSYRNTIGQSSFIKPTHHTHF